MRSSGETTGACHGARCATTGTTLQEVATTLVVADHPHRLLYGGRQHPLVVLVVMVAEVLRLQAGSGLLLITALSG